MNGNDNEELYDDKTMELSEPAPTEKKMTFFQRHITAHIPEIKIKEEYFLNGMPVGPMGPWIKQLDRILNDIAHKCDRYVMEFIGTFYLVLVIGLTTAMRDLGLLVPIAIGSVLMVQVFTGGHISGAHFNPSVSFAVFLCGRGIMPFERFIKYMMCQFLGGFFGAWIAYGVTGQVVDAFVPGCRDFETVATRSECLGEYTPGQMMACEAFFTFLLATVVLNVATTRTLQGNSFFGLGIGFTVIAGAASVGEITGGAFNPAVALAISLVNVFYGNNAGKYIYIYFIGELIGVLFAAIVFRLTNPAEFDHYFKSSEEQKKESKLVPVDSVKAIDKPDSDSLEDDM